MNISLDQSNYTIYNALTWQYCREHYIKAGEGTWKEHTVRKLVHGFIAALELLPIASIIEYLASKIFGAKSSNSASAPISKANIFALPKNTVYPFKNFLQTPQKDFCITAVWKFCLDPAFIDYLKASEKQTDPRSIKDHLFGLSSFDKNILSMTCSPHCKDLFESEAAKLTPTDLKSAMDDLFSKFTTDQKRFVLVEWKNKALLFLQLETERAILYHPDTAMGLVSKEEAMKYIEMKLPEQDRKAYTGSHPCEQCQM